MEHSAPSQFKLEPNLNIYTYINDYARNNIIVLELQRKKQLLPSVWKHKYKKR